MNIDLVDLGAVVVLVIPLLILLAGLFADPLELELHAPPRVLDWPLGVQEEEPTRWRVEAFTPPGRRDGLAGSAFDTRRDDIDRAARRLGSKPVA